MDTDLGPRQQAEAQRICQAPRRAAGADLLAPAPLLAAKPGGRLPGATPFRARDAAHRVGAEAIGAAPSRSKKGPTAAPAAPAPAAERHAPTGGRPRRPKAPSGPSA